MKTGTLPDSVIVLVSEAEDHDIERHTLFISDLKTFEENFAPMTSPGK
jgi:hypothetical protein